ncbi:MAG: hypothetical protein GXP54_12460 [Deltaproteobacteria bacterium]|nr:hypothetical protein [Deltaproteobacteria bacterium]
METRLKTFLAALGGSVVTMVLALGVTAMADSNPETDQVPRLVPYQGTLEKDGKPVTGAVDLVFDLYDGPATDTPVWTETLNVAVYAGRFSAVLGSSSGTSATDLAKVLTDADDVYLGVSVKTDPDTVVPLSNRQRFLPVPYALWTTAATDFKVGRDVHVGRNLDVSGEIVLNGPITTKDSLHVDGSAYFGGTNYQKHTIIEGAENDGNNAALRITTNDQTMLIDGNEIDSKEDMVYLSNNSKMGAKVVGDLAVTGTAKLGLEYVYCKDTGSCYCPAGTKIIGGGGDCGDNAFLHESYPKESENRWHVYCKDGGPQTPNASFAICARIGN